MHFCKKKILLKKGLTLVRPFFIRLFYRLFRKFLFNRLAFFLLLLFKYFRVIIRIKSYFSGVRDNFFPLPSYPPSNNFLINSKKNLTMERPSFILKSFLLISFVCILVSCGNDDGGGGETNVDIEATYSINTPKEVDEYVNGDILASASDADGAITQAALQSTSSLPAGVALNSTSGELTVSNANSLIAGTFAMAITTTDSEEGTTDHNVSIVINERVDIAASYTVNEAKFISEYAIEELIATVSDDDGAIVSAVLTNGTMLPAGTLLDPSTGKIIVESPSLLVAGEYAIEITTEDALGGETTHMITLTFIENPFVLNINSGGAELTLDGITYLADQFFVGTSVEFTPDPIPEIDNTENDELYITERYGSDFGYEVQLDEGTYQVVLHFVELYWGAPGLGVDGGTGDRVFDVSIEGAVVLDDYDIFSEVGALFATQKEFEVMVSDGMLNIDLLSSVDNAKITAIEIQKMN